MYSDASAIYGPYKAIYNCFVCSQVDEFGRILMELVKQGADTEEIKVDVDAMVRHCYENCWRGHLKAHRTAASLVKKKLFHDYKTTKQGL